MSEAVIDLGTVVGPWSEAKDPPAAERPPARAGPGVVAAAILVIVVFLGGSSTSLVPRPAPPVVLSVGVPVWFAVDERTVYAARGSAGLTAYDLPDLRSRWTAPLVVTSTMRVAAPGREILTLAPLAPRSEVVGLDFVTGAERWRAQGYPLWRSPDGRQLVVASSGAQERIAGSREPRRLLGYDTTTGENLWTHTVASALGQDLSIVYGQRDGAALVAALITEADGDVTLVDFGTGVARPLSGLPTVTTLRLADDLLLIVPAGEPESVMAFERDTLRLRWMVAGVTMRTASDCDQLVCLQSAGGTVAVDRRSGAVRWRADWSTVAGNSARVIAARSQVSGSGDTAVLAASTGRTLLDLPSWRALVVGDRLVPILRRDAAARVSRLAVLDVETLAVRTIGEVAGDGLTCQASHHMIGCVTGPGEMTVWRYA